MCRPRCATFRISGPHDLINGLIAQFADYRKRLEDAVASGTGVPVSGVKLRAPLPKPGNIVCMAVNYMENGTRKEPAPINAFHKAPTLDPRKPAAR